MYEYRYKHRDTEQNIPNNFAPDLIENKIFSIPVIIYLLDKGFMKRDCVPADVLKRVNAENEFIDSQINKTKPISA
ncbi:MAG: hypothetical protein KJI69_03740 [Patescibacteria group bacterium]|nr:hypothetical protein [Patescibacteria group bacterium]